MNNHTSLEIQNSPNAHPRFPIDPWGGIGLEPAWLAKMQTCHSSKTQLLEGGTHNAWHMRDVNQNDRPPFYLPISSGRPKMKPLAMSFCSRPIPLLANQVRQNNNAASDFKVCVTIKEHLEAQNFVDRMGK